MCLPYPASTLGEHLSECFDTFHLVISILKAKQPTHKPSSHILWMQERSSICEEPISCNTKLNALVQHLPERDLWDQNWSLQNLHGCSLQMHYMRYTHITSHTLDTPLTAHEMPADMAAVKLVITPLHPSSSEDFLTCIVWICYVHGSSSLWFRPTAKRLDSWWNGMRGTSNLTIQEYKDWSQGRLLTHLPRWWSHHRGIEHKPERTPSLES